MSNAVQFMNGKSLGIAATLPSLVGERFNAVERTPEEHEQAVLRMIERAERNQDLFTGEPLDFISNVGEWHDSEGNEIEENDELDLDTEDIED